MAKYYSSIDLNKNELQNARIHNLAADPATPVGGQIYFNTTAGVKKLFYYNESQWVTPLTLSDASTITAVHTFNPAIAGAPFVIGANGSGQLVTGLNADSLDGQHGSYYLDVTKFTALTASRALTTNSSGIITVSNVTDTELGYLSGVTSSVQTQLGAKVPLAGGTMTGALTLHADPTNDMHAATKRYVDGYITSGIAWKKPVLAVNMISDALTTPPPAPTEGDAYIPAAGATGLWSTLVGHIVQWSGSAWTDLGVLATGDRVIVTDGTPAGSFATKDNNIAERADSSWLFDVPSDGDTAVVTEGFYADYQFTFNGTTWVQSSGAGQITAGNGLTKTMNTIDVVGTTNRIVVNADSVDIGSDVVTLTATQSLTNKTINDLTLTKAADGFTIAGGTTSRTLTITGANKTIQGAGTTIALGGNLTTSGAYALTLTLSNTTNVTLPVTGTLATLGGTETLTNKTLTTPTIGNFTNAQHTHADAANGGTIAITSCTGTLAVTHGGTGLTSIAAGSMIYASATDTLSALAIGTAGKIIRSNGTTPAYSTATFADTYAASSLLYSNGANTVTGLATGNNGVLVTNGTGVPSISSTLPTNIAMTTPKITTGIKDASGATMFSLTPTGTAVNYFTFTNAATTGTPAFGATGSDTNVALNLTTKGTGVLKFNGTQIMDTSRNMSNIGTFNGVTISTTSITGCSTFSGNASTATKLAAAVTISGVSFDGSANITIDADDVGATQTKAFNNTAGVSADYVHNLGTTDVMVMIKRIASPYDIVYTDIEVKDANTVTVKFATDPGAGVYRIIVIGQLS